MGTKSSLEGLLDDGILNVEVDRRLFLGLPFVGYFAAGTAQAQTAGQIDVLYGGWMTSSDLDDQKDVLTTTKTELGRLLGENVADNLKVVKKKGERLFGLIYDRTSSDENIEKVLARHNDIIGPLDLGDATQILESEYEKAYNISFGKGKNLADLKKDFEEVYSLLGNQLGKQLVIEERPGGVYTLVYTRRGDAKSSKKRAMDLTLLLQNHSSRKISASITLESLHEVIYSESVYLDERQPQTKSTSPITIPKKEEPKKALPKGPMPTPKRIEPKIETAQGDLGKLLSGEIGTYRSKGILSTREKTAWAVYDLSENKLVAGINHATPMQAASMIKPFVALAYFHQVQQGKLSYDAAAKKHLERMIQKSSNASTNWFIEKLGGANAVNSILKSNSNYASIFKEGKVVEQIPAGGQTYKNTMSANDGIRLLSALYSENILSAPNKPNYARELKRAMALPKRNRIYSGVPNIPSGTQVYSKSGSTAMMIGDMGIIGAQKTEGKTHWYAIVGMIQSDERVANYGSHMRTMGNVIRKISAMTYDFLKPNNNLR